MAGEKEEIPMSRSEREMECRRRVESILQLQPQKQSTDQIPFQSSYRRMNDQASSDDRKLGKQTLERGEASTPNHTNSSSHATRKPWQRYSNLQIHEKRQKRPMPYAIGFSSSPKPKTRPSSIFNPNPSPSGQAALDGQSVKPLNIFCEVCKIFCWTYFNFKQHLSGRKHRNKMNGNKHPVCELCKIECSDESCLQMHFSGKKHKAKLLNSQVLDEMNKDA